MIKLFRNIRQNLLNQGQTSKYFKYAIGEIFLVVIGILIALSINNWNTKLQKENVQTSFLIKLDTELQYNINRLNALTDMYNAIQERNLKLYDTLIAGITKQNVETHLTTVTFNSSTLNLSSSTYEQMKNTGNLHTLSSDSLLNAIEAYYKLCERENYYILNRNGIVDNNTDNDINKGITKAQFDFRAKGLDYVLQNNAWLLDTQSKEYATLIREFIFIKGSVNNILIRIDKIINESKSLKELIRKDLEKRKL